MLFPRHIKDRSLAKLLFSLSVAAVVAACLPLMARDGAAQVAAGQPPPSVVVETVQYTDLKGTATYSGRIEAVNKIELRTRVAGLITKREFQEGAAVEKGQLLFEIDRRAYEIALAQAQATLASSQSAMNAASDTYTRTEELVARQVSTSANLTSSKSQLDQAKAKVAFDQAQVQQAKLNLDYTQIRAEMSGRIGRVAHAVGDFVDEASTPLATLISEETVYVTFAVPRPALADLQKSKDGIFQADVELRFGDGEIYGHAGKIAFVDTEANAATNTITVRAMVPNPDRALLPNELVDVTIIDKHATKTLVISQSALLLDQLGSYVLSVDTKNKVSIRRFEPGIYRGSYVTVKSGLAEGERVIISGHLKAQPGMIVDPQSAPIEVSNSSGNPTP